MNPRLDLGPELADMLSGQEDNGHCYPRTSLPSSGTWLRASRCAWRRVPPTLRTTTHHAQHLLHRCHSGAGEPEDFLDTRDPAVCAQESEARYEPEGHRTSVEPPRAHARFLTAASL